MSQIEQHTSGPWTASFYKLGEVYLVRSEKAPHVSGVVCNVAYGNSGGTLRPPTGEELEIRRAIGRANALLIAAAPELLAALERLDRVFWPPQSGHPDATKQAITAAHDVLAALKGETDATRD